VTAVPGSGKTATLTQRVVKLMDSGADPRSICCITFTNKASEEMKERIRDLDPAAKRVWVSTFHRLGVKLLRSYGDRVGLREGFSIYDDDDCKGLMSKVHRMYSAQTEDDAKLTPRDRGTLLNRAGDLRESAKPFDLETEDPRIAMYIRELHDANAVDFSGMLYMTWKILTKCPDIAAKLSKRFEFVMVDEAQDTNDIQYAIAKILASHGNLFMVGDYQQCVHGDEEVSVMVGKEPKTFRVQDLPKTGLIHSYRNGTEIYSPYTRDDSTATSGFRFYMESGAELMVSSRHKMFSSGLKDPHGFVLYLMYRPDKGFRVGISSGKLLYGHRHRHELATKLWVLEVLPDKESALLSETEASLTFGVPTCVFQAENRGINQSRVDRVFGQFGQNGKAVLDHYNLDFDLPLWSAKSYTTRTYSRNNVYLCAHGTKGSQVWLEWTDPGISVEVRKLGVSITKAKASKRIKHRWRCRKFFTNYKQAESFAEKLAAATGSGINERITVEKEHLLLTTASAVKPGCYLPRKTSSGLVLDKVVSVEPISGKFVSLSVETGVFFNRHGILSHNSIFSWRGAKPENLKNFQKDYPGALILELPRNYRSRSEILEKAQNVIRQNPNNDDVELISERGSGGAVKIHRMENEWEEANHIAHLANCYHDQGYKWDDMAVIYRLNKQSQAFEMSLSQNSIPYKTKGGPSFFARKEIKTTLAYMKLLGNPEDSAAFAQAIGNPKRGVGDVLVGKIDLLAKKKGISVMEAAAQVKTGRNSTRGLIDDFDALLEQKREKMKGGTSLMTVVDELVKESGYMGQLRNEAAEEKDGPRSIQRLENLETFIIGIGEFEDANSKPTMDKFLQQIALVQDGDKDKSTDAISLMSMHSAKGLEFPVVFIVGAANNVVPFVLAVDEGRGDEERRLFYVAVTRAKDHLHVSYPESVRKWSSTIEQDPSPFLYEMFGRDPNEEEE